MDESEIRALARLIDRLDYYKLLRVDHQATLPEIRTAYQRMRRLFHPDKFSSSGVELVHAVDRISKRLNEAYLTLRDAARREVYDKRLAGGELRLETTPTETRLSEAREAEIGNTPNGRRFVTQAEGHVRMGEIKKAMAALQMALTFEPTNEKIKARLAELRAR